jgi:hypothetical protein
MENIKQIESILYVSKQKIGDNAYIELMRNLSEVYRHVCEHKDLGEGFECPHCQQEIEYDEIEND